MPALFDKLMSARPRKQGPRHIMRQTRSDTPLVARSGRLGRSGQSGVTAPGKLGEELKQDESAWQTRPVDVERVCPYSSG